MLQHSRSLSVLRWTALCVAALLAVQCIWLLLAELPRSDVMRLPTGAPAAAAAAQQRDGATRAAAFGFIRGGLWAQASFTYADLLWGKNGAEANGGVTAAAQAEALLYQAVKDAPCDSSAWLLLAGLTLRYRLDRWDATAALKMSYYTGPSENDLIPFRFLLAVNSDRSSDPEMRLFITRDLRFLLSNNQTNDVVNAYKAAPRSEKAFIEQTVSQLDPAALPSLRAVRTSPALPD
jgi:hypothetical protein